MNFESCNYSVIKEIAIYIDYLPRDNRVIKLTITSANLTHIGIAIVIYLPCEIMILMMMQSKN